MKSKELVKNSVKTAGVISLVAAGAIAGFIKDDDNRAVGSKTPMTLQEAREFKAGLTPEEIKEQLHDTPPGMAIQHNHKGRSDLWGEGEFHPVPTPEGASTVGVKDGVTLKAEAIERKEQDLPYDPTLLPQQQQQEWPDFQAPRSHKD